MKSMRNRTMGILIQEQDTKQFYRHHDRWTFDRKDATDFESCAAAIKTIRDKKLKADILLAFADASYDMNIPGASL